MLHDALRTQGIIQTDLLEMIMALINLQVTIASLGGMLKIAGFIQNPHPDLAAMIQFLQVTLPQIDLDIGQAYADVAQVLQSR